MLTKGKDGSSVDPPGRRMWGGLGLAQGLGLGAAPERADSWTSGLSCVAVPRGLSCTTAPSPRSILAKETGESGSCRRPVAAAKPSSSMLYDYDFITVFS